MVKKQRRHSSHSRLLQFVAESVAYFSYSVASSASRRYAAVMMRLKIKYHRINAIEKTTLNLTNQLR